MTLPLWAASAAVPRAMDPPFQAADTNHDGWLFKDELIMMRQRARGGR